MADFRTHFNGAAVVSGVATLPLLVSGAVSHVEALALMGTGLVGGLLPDIDSDNSVPVRAAFTFIAIGAAFGAVFAFVDRLSLTELALLWWAVYVGVQLFVFEAFTRLTVHRGLIHSLPAGLFAMMLAVWLAWAALGLAPPLAWGIGVFLLLGFLVHLVLDELASVDLLGRRVKRSLGSAFKFGSLRNPIGTVGLYLACALLLLPLPEPVASLGQLLDPVLQFEFSHRLWPAWLQGLDAPRLGPASALDAEPVP